VSTAAVVGPLVAGTTRPEPYAPSNALGAKLSSPPTTAFCEANFGIACYQPAQLQKAYDLQPLYNRGLNGAGKTIVIVDSFGSPTIPADLQTFDAAFGLPAPPSFKIIQPAGAVPPYPDDPFGAADRSGWAFETTLDVEWAHALAPGANIVLLTSPVAETEGTVGMPEFLALETYALDHHLGHIISQSWSATENTLFDAPGKKVIAEFEALYQRAAAQHVTVFASAGDNGSTNQELDGVTLFPFPNVGYPASSAYVTAVGGTSLTADTSGNYASEVVWNDEWGAGGGGVSQTFREPIWQAALPPAVQRQLAGHRGLPDISYNADPDTAILVYMSTPGYQPGYYTVGGTSEGSPQWAGIMADFNQLAGRPIGYLNPKLYALAELGALGDLTHDITVGNNAFDGVTGYTATRGWDLATGWGTPRLADLGKALAALPDDDTSN